MPHFYFRLDECGTVTEDLEGRILSDLAAALETARRDARAIMADEVQNGELCLSCHIDIMNAAGTHLARLRFDEAVTISGACHPIDG